MILDLQRCPARDQNLAVIAPFGLHYRQLKTDAVAAFHRRDEPDLVQTIVEDGRGIRRGKPQLHRQRRRQRETQKTMRDGRTHRALLACALDVGVDPLTVPGAAGKLVDHRLIDPDPVRRAEILADKVLDRCERYRRHVPDTPLRYSAALSRRFRVPPAIFR
jgi:hypothetical protein